MSKSREELVQVANSAAALSLVRVKRMTDKAAGRARSVAFKAVTRADRTAGTASHPDGAAYSHGLHEIAVEGATIALDQWHEVQRVGGADGVRRKHGITTARRKSPLHPAIVALHAAHAAFRTERANDVGPCFDSDLVHDDKAITANPEQAFVWFVSRHGTHMCRLGTASECYADVRRTWSETSVGRYTKSVCVECYEPSAIPDGWLQVYLWDGASLQRFTTLADLRRATARTITTLAQSHLKTRATDLRETVAGLKALGGTFNGYTLDTAEAALAACTSEIESIEGWEQ